MTFQQVGQPGTREANPSQDTLYTGYGLIVRSEVALPLTPAAETAAPVDVTIRVQTGPAPALDAPVVAWMPCEVHGVDMRVHRDASGTWIWQRDLAIFGIAPDWRQVDVWPIADVLDERALGLALVGPVLLFLLLVRGMPPLHASAVMVDGRAFAFLGVPGQGKSTMAAAFLRRGAQILTDDALPLAASSDGLLLARPGPPYMKLWQATATHTLGITGPLPNLHGGFEKKFLALDVATVPQMEARLSAIYVLKRYDPIASQRCDVLLQPISAREATAQVLTHTMNRIFLTPLEQASLLPFYVRLIKQAPVRELIYPSGFEYQENVCARILEDLGVVEGE